MDNQSRSYTDREFAEVYERHINMVYRLSFILLKNTYDADDAVQSVFMKLFKHNRAFHDREHEKAWIIVTTQNTCKDVLKSWWRSRRIDMDALPEKTYWNDNEQHTEVLEQLLRLPEKYRTVLYLYYYEDYSVKEISQLLNRKESTIQTQLAKGRARLKTEMGGVYGDRTTAQGNIRGIGAK